MTSASPTASLVEMLADYPVWISYQNQKQLLILKAETVRAMTRTTARAKMAEALLFIDGVDNGEWALEQPIAAFRGLRRPFHGAASALHDDANGWYSDDHMIVYVLNPNFEFRVNRSMIEKSEARQGAVFVVYWRRYDDPTIRNSLRSRLGHEPIKGIPILS